MMKIYVFSFANDLPDEILTDILTRLPADSVVLCKSVCRRWRKFIKSPFFINSHLRSSKGVLTNPILYVDSSNLWPDKSLSKTPQKFQRVLWWGTSTSTSIVHSRENAHIEFMHGSFSPQETSELRGSCDGLVVFERRTPPIFVKVANPTTKELRVIENAPSRGENPGYICGFFFDRFNEDYKLLYVDVIWNDVYYVFSLRENVWRRLDSIPACLGFRPQTSYPPVVVCDALHWIAAETDDCLKTLVVFDIKTGRMQALPHPCQNGHLCSIFRGDRDHNHEKLMQLIVKDEKLCFCHIIVRERKIDLWILEEYTNWESWVRKFNVNLLFVDKKFMSVGYDSRHSREPVQVLSSPKGTNEILFCWRGLSTTTKRGLYRYDLETHGNSHLKTFDWWHWRHGNPYVIVPYTKTLLPPYLPA